MARLGDCRTDRAVPTLLRLAGQMGAAPAGGHLEESDDQGFDFGLERAAVRNDAVRSGLQIWICFFVF